MTNVVLIWLPTFWHRNAQKSGTPTPRPKLQVGLVRSQRLPARPLPAPFLRFLVFTSALTATVMIPSGSAKRPLALWGACGAERSTDGRSPKPGPLTFAPGSPWEETVQWKVHPVTTLAPDEMQRTCSFGHGTTFFASWHRHAKAQWPATGEDHSRKACHVRRAKTCQPPGLP